MSASNRKDDLDTLLTIDGKGRAAKWEALKRLMEMARQEGRDERPIDTAKRLEEIKAILLDTAPVIYAVRPDELEHDALLALRDELANPNANHDQYK